MTTFPNTTYPFIDATDCDVDVGVKYRYYDWIKMTDEERIGVWNDYKKKINNGSCEARPNLKNKLKLLTEWIYCDDWEDIKCYNEIKDEYGL